MQREATRACQLIVDEPLCRSYTVIKDILFLQPHPGFVPALTVLRTTTEVDDDINAALLKPREVHRGKAWGQGDVKAAVAIHQCRIIAIAFNATLGNNKHRDLCAILGLEENLLDIVVGWLEVLDNRRFENR